MNHYKLYILISTIDNRILNLRSMLQAYNQNIYYIISHQVTGQLDHDTLHYINELIERQDVQYSSLKGNGVARNRNNTLRFIKPHTICLILDDDVTLCANAFESVVKSFEENPSAEFVSFKILDLDGNDYKPYSKEKHWHTFRSLTGIGTTEMAFKSDLILNNNILFDERFGPGSDLYPTGEDFIFAMDLYKMKTKMLFLPIPIVKHPAVSTGGRHEEKVIFGKGAVFARVLGWKAFMINMLFSIKKYKQYHKDISFFSYFLLLSKGTVAYLNFSRKRTSCKS